MADETPAPEVPQTPESPPAGELSPEAKGLLKDLQAERERRKEFEQKLSEMEKAQKDAEQKRLEEQEQFKTLYEQEKEAHAQTVQELKPLAEQWTGYNEKRRAELLEKLGDDADNFKNLELGALEAVVKRLTKTNELPAEPGRPTRSPSGDFGGYKTLRELAEAAVTNPKARAEYKRIRGL